MKLKNKLVYMVLGGLLALALTFGAYATLAQTDETKDAPSATEESESGDAILPFFSQRGFRQLGRDNAREALMEVDEQELLANALGISVEELQAAQLAVKKSVLEQAVADGLLTQAQADELLESSNGFRGRGLCGLGLQNTDYAAKLAAELGISVEELQTALNEVQAARLAAMVEAGVLTQEQADLMSAYDTVQGYVDYEGLNASVKSYFQAAIEQALVDGVITQAQADLMLENLTNLNMRGFPGGRMPGMGGRGGHGGFGGHGPGFMPIPSGTTTNSSGF